MDKISGILPSSARITTVDTRNTLAARPGALALGRSEGESNIAKNALVRNIHSKFHQSNQFDNLHKKENVQARIVESMSDNFFRKRVDEIKSQPLTPGLISSQDILSQMNGQVGNEGALSISPQENESVSLATVGRPSIANGDPSGVTVGSSTEESESDNLDAPGLGRYLDVRA